jgi:hypothetical protein
MSTPNPSASDLTGLVRYVLTIDNMSGPDSVVEVRELLTNLGFVVDRVSEGEAEVASTSSEGPGKDAIRAALNAKGYHLVESDTNVG